MTHDDGWDVSPSWQEVRAERDVLIAELRANAACIEGLQAERDALAAHVEVLRDDLQEYHDQYGDDPIARKHDMGAALKEEPTTSFDRLKAEWQAEALYLATGLVAMPTSSRTYLHKMAERLRRQASGDDS